MTYLDHLLDFIRLHSFISINVNGEGVIRITDRDTAGRGIILLGYIGTDLPNIFISQCVPDPLDVIYSIVFDTLGISAPSSTSVHTSEITC